MLQSRYQKLADGAIKSGTMNIFSNHISLALIMFISGGLLYAHYEPSYRFDLSSWALWMCVAGLLYPISLFWRVADERQSANKKVDEECRQGMRNAGMSEEKIAEIYKNGIPENWQKP